MRKVVWVVFSRNKVLSSRLTRQVQCDFRTLQNALKWRKNSIDEKCNSMNSELRGDDVEGQNPGGWRGEIT